LGRKYTRGVPDVVVVGSASRDVAAGDRRGWRLGGGVSYGALTAARLGLRTAAIVGVDGTAATAIELDLLRQAGVDVELVELRSAPVFDNVQTPAGRVQECLEPGLPLPPERTPVAWRNAPAWLLAPVAGELPDGWAEVPSPDAVVALGWQGLLRRLAAGRHVERLPPTASPIVRRAGLVGVSTEDLDPGQEVAALTRLLRPAATLLLTRSDGGGLAIATDGDEQPASIRAYPAIPARHVVDPTGAGDVLLAAYLATRLVPELAGLRSHGSDLRFAASAASLVVEGPGLTAVPDLAAVLARLRASVASRPAGRRPPPEPGASSVAPPGERSQS